MLELQTLNIQTTQFHESLSSNELSEKVSEHLNESTQHSHHNIHPPRKCNGIKLLSWIKLKFRPSCEFVLILCGRCTCPETCQYNHFSKLLGKISPVFKPCPRQINPLWSGVGLQLSTNLREVSQCLENAFSLLKAPTSAFTVNI